MTIFNSTRNSEYEARTLKVSTVDGMTNICIKRSKDALGLTLDAGTVPEIAIEAIKASGVKPRKYGSLTHGTPEHLASITADLESYIEHRDAAAERAAREAERLAKVAAEEAAAEAADRAELAALARTIYETHIGPGAVLFFPWTELRQDKQSHWISTARAAREACAELSKP